MEDKAEAETEKAFEEYLNSFPPAPSRERRRPRFAEHETDTAFEVFIDALDMLCESRRLGHERFPKAEIIFKILWRFTHYKPGPPKYPKNISWATMEAFVAPYLL